MSYPVIDAVTGCSVMVDGTLYDLQSETVMGLRQPGNSIMYYEVIRIIDHTPLFWEDHLDRLKKSVNNKFNFPVCLYEECKKLIADHIRLKFDLDQINLRIILTPEKRVIHLIPSYYPSPELFARGVPVLIIDWERENPNVKMIKSDYKQAVARGFARENIFGSPFELILADNKGYFTEGSRSNLFFIRQNQVLSAPDNKILLGITRKYVMQAIKQAGADFVIQMINKEELSRDDSIDAAFLSGSPIDLLAISSIEDKSLKSAENELFNRINREYQKIVQNYVNTH